MKTVLGIVILTIVVVGLIIVGPIFTIWSLNTLFNLGIPVDMSTWLAVSWLTLVTVGNLTSAIKNTKD
jgi:hypothetical protein